MDQISMTKRATSKMRRVVAYLNNTIAIQTSWHSDNDIQTRCMALEIVRRAMYRVQDAAQ